MAIRIQIRRDTTANWATHNPTLAQGEMALELNNETLAPFGIKIGDGLLQWADLPYFYIQGGEGRQIIDFNTAIKLDKDYVSLHVITGAIAFTFESTPVPKLAKNHIIYITANGANKPTFSTDFEVVWDNWMNDDGAVNRIEFEKSGSKVLVHMQYIIEP